ncbi:MAG: phosphonate ABC transporter ATP-binding protein [Thermoanaerobaculia bacterium]
MSTAERDPADPAIRFDHASVVYPSGVKGLDGVDLSIERGQLVVVVGLSGAGKSTLLRSINGLVQLTGGDVLVEGRSVRRSRGAALRALRARVGMIFQDHRLVKRLSVLTNVLLGRVARVPVWRQVLGLWPRADVDIALQALERVGLRDRAGVRASQLSGGQQQRVGIARALAQEPGVVLADEPVASLDPMTSHRVMQDLQRINRDLSITTLVNLHFLDLAKRYAQRIVGLRQGAVVYDGPADEVGEADFAQIYGRSMTAEDVLEGFGAR